MNENPPGFTKITLDGIEHCAFGNAFEQDLSGGNIEGRSGSPDRAGVVAEGD